MNRHPYTLFAGLALTSLSMAVTGCKQPQPVEVSPAAAPAATPAPSTTIIEKDVRVDHDRPVVIDRDHPVVIDRDHPRPEDRRPPDRP